MFERFTDRARAVVKCTQQEARDLGHRTIGTEHLLLALLDPEAGIAYQVLHACGLDRDEVRQFIASGDDAAALRSIGIDLEEVRSRVEAEFGPGALDPPRPARRFGFLFRKTAGHSPFGGGAKKALELSLRIALSLKHNYIGTEHILLGVIKEERGLGARILREAGVTYEHAQSLVLTALKHAA